MNGEAVSPPPAAGRRRSSCLLVGCIVLFVLVTVPGALVWGVFAAAEPARNEPRHEVKAHSLPPGPGTIELDVRMAEVEVRPAAAGSPLRLEADWNAGVFRLTEGLHQEGGGWRYELRFRARGLALLRSHHHGPNTLRLEVPVDHPLSITGELSLAETDLDFGGLTLDEIDLELGAGEHDVAFSQPTPRPMTRLALAGSMGEITVFGAGNASPRRIEVQHGMGELRLDLSGRWRADGEVAMHLGMGDAQVTLPGRDEAAAVVEKARMSIGEKRVEDVAEAELPAGLPRVRVRATGGMGDLRIH
jgi:hypothetical protein